ncbi:radical SAM protein [Williamsia sp. 1135]|uniref:radical SAM protein n=1 Tax=Williamsia sp. 1135 TaxID=1889262 RepID=UPI000A10C551|nr:radical SAM protein [Williamsia sp. 1135]ORM27800.1 molybdenum cofactor biosynthesis protein [Williamsia sp. 1135]
MPVAFGRLRVFLTEQCNLACFYCHNEGQPKGGGYLSDRLYDAVATMSRQPEVDKVILSGGEPLLHPRVLDMVDAVAPHVARVSVITNGLLLTRPLARDLAAAGLSKVRLGVDSFRSDKPRPSAGYLDAPFSIDAVVAAVRDAGLRIEVNVVLTRFNQREVPRFLEWAVANELDIKFFEHLEVRPARPGEFVNIMRPRPQVSEAWFMQTLAQTLGHLPDFVETDAFAPATSAARVGATEIRYCRYLCTYHRCAAPGTRFDVAGFVYTCMSNRGLDRVDDLGVQSLREVFARASGRTCSAGDGIEVPMKLG